MVANKANRNAEALLGKDESVVIDNLQALKSNMKNEGMLINMT